MIQPGDRLSAVLARDARLLDVLVAAVPALETLRSAAMQRTMAPRVTVEQAAQIGGLEAELLVERLNHALGDAAEPPRTSAPLPVLPPAMLPLELSALSPELIVDLDVRDDLRAGREPFARIMGAARALSPEQVLRLRAIFEPAPLYRVFAKKGRSHFTEQLASDDWRVWFFSGGDAAPLQPARATPAEDDVIVLDVRDLEPPEPMIRTLELLASMPRGKTLLQLNVRVPQFLLPKLDEQGFVYEIREQSADLVRLFIRHRPN